MLSLVLLAGGKGVRFGGETPKQYLPLLGKPLVLHSLEALVGCVDEVVVVAAEEWRHVFDAYDVVFAEPGARRQDSVENGLRRASGRWIVVHDGARPFVEVGAVEQLLEEGMEVGAATLGTPVRATIKECAEGGEVVRTPDRATLWEIQTPQLVRRDILEAGFAVAGDRTVTDDVSLAELAGYSVRVVEGPETNIKITTARDFRVAEGIR